MKNEILDIYKENFLIIASFVFILFFPIILLLGSSFINISIIIMNILFLAHIFGEKKFQIFNNDIFYFLTAFWFLLIINTLLNDNFNDNFTRGFGFIRFILLIFSFSYFLSYKNFKFRKTIFKLWSIIFIIVSLDLIFEFYFGFNSLGFKSTYSGRLAGFMGDELKIGHWYLCFSLIILAANFKKTELFYFILFSAVIVSFLIGERANFIRLLLAFIFFIPIVKKITLKNLSYTILAIIIAFLVILNHPSKEKIKNRFFGQFVEKIIQHNSLKEFNEINAYTPMYINAFHLFKENKVLGVGAGSYREKSYEIYIKTKRINGYRIIPNTHPHQHHFEILATLGLSGYLFLLLFFLYFFQKSIKLYLKTKNVLNLASFMFVFVFCLPLLPTGSFFTTYGASMFWLNFSLMNLGNFKNINH